MLQNQRFVSKAVDVQLARNKMSQAALARKVGVSENYMSRLINNKADWNLSLMDKVGTALGVAGLFGLIDLAKEEQRLSSPSLEVTA